MSHSLTKIWIHGIIRTKNSAPLIKPDFENELYEHIKTRLEMDFGCKLRAINGTVNHLHILFLQSPLISISDLFKNVKGETSHWINNSNFSTEKFVWQTGYAAFSVSESMLDKLEFYVKNQKEHHKKISFEEEINVFMKKYGLKIINR